VSEEGSYPPEGTDPPGGLDREDEPFSRLGDALIEAGKRANAREKKTWHIDGKQWVTPVYIEGLLWGRRPRPRMSGSRGEFGETTCRGPGAASSVMNGHHAGQIGLRPVAS
jgi:hypothetical protein